MCLPALIGDYTDFYASRHHAINVGKLFRPDQPLLENYDHIPIAYHGRASSIVVSGTPVRRPIGQLGAGKFAPSHELDYEVELGAFIGPGNASGRTYSYRRGGRSSRRSVPAERLVRARHSALGISTARPISREELRHIHIALAHHIRSARALSSARTPARSTRSAVPAIPSTRRIRYPAQDLASNRKNEAAAWL